MTSTARAVPARNCTSSPTARRRPRVTDYARYWHGLPRLYVAAARTVEPGHGAADQCHLDPCGGGRLFYRPARSSSAPRAAAVFIVVLLGLPTSGSCGAISHARDQPCLFILLGVAGFALLYDRWRSPYLAVALRGALRRDVQFPGYSGEPADDADAARLRGVGGAGTSTGPARRRNRSAPVGSAALVTVSWIGAYALTWGDKMGARGVGVT